MITAGSILTKVSELRSKVAIVEALILHLTNNYITTEDEKGKTPPEMVLAREDFSAVPETHITSLIQDLRETADAYQEELKQWEDMPMAEPTKKGKKNADDRNQGTAASKDVAG